MKKAISLLILIIVIIVVLFTFTGCSSSKQEITTSKEAILTGGPDTQIFIPNINLSSESFLGTGIQLPSADVISSITIDNYNNVNNDKQPGIFIIDSKEDIGNFLDFINSLKGNLGDYNEYYTFVTFYKFEFNYNMGVDSTRYVDSLSFGSGAFLYSSRLLGVTNFTVIELDDKFESYCINQK